MYLTEYQDSYGPPADLERTRTVWINARQVQYVTPSEYGWTAVYFAAGESSHSLHVAEDFAEVAEMAATETSRIMTYQPDTSPDRSPGGR